jgi:hypothetical protein
MNPRLTSLLKGMKNIDPAAFRVKPMPIQVLHHAQSLIDPQNDAQQILLDAAYIGFFYLLRPGEYLTVRNGRPICLRNITFQATTSPSVDHAMQALTSSPRRIQQATYSAITFDDQKNLKVKPSHMGVPFITWLARLRRSNAAFFIFAHITRIPTPPCSPCVVMVPGNP